VTSETPAISNFVFETVFGSFMKKILSNGVDLNHIKNTTYNTTVKA